MNSEPNVDSKNYKDLFRKILWSLGLLCLYLLLSHVLAWGFNHQQLKNISQSGLLQMLDTFSGGSLSNFSIAALGISPFINAQIIMQILQTDLGWKIDLSIPMFVQWAKEGETGRKFLNYATLILSIPFAIMSSLGIIKLVESMGVSSVMISRSPWVLLAVILQLTITSLILAVISLSIDSKGIGNGISLLIATGILKNFPHLVLVYVNGPLKDNTLKIFMFALVFLLICWLMVMVQESARKLKVSYAGKYKDLEKKHNSYIPILLNPSNVMSIIFGTVIMQTLQVIFSGLGKEAHQKWLKWVGEYLFNFQSLYGMALLAVLLVAITYLYSFIQYNPLQIAYQLKPNNGIIEDQPMGNATIYYLKKVLLRLDAFGAVYIVLITIIPMLINFYRPNWGLGSFALIGSNLLIILTVASEQVYRVKAELDEIQYKPFI